MGHGMLVYHVDFDDSFLLSNNSVNNVKGTPRMNVLPADGRLISSYEVDDDKKIITTAMYRASHGGDPYP
jgi:immune inhibitor A